MKTTKPKFTARAEALWACELLVQAYRNGKANGGSVEWSDVDDAEDRAKKALRRAKREDKEVGEVMTLDALTALLERLFGKNITIFSKRRTDGTASHTLTQNDRMRATWESRLVGNPPADGKTPRGSSEYFDLKFL